MLSGLAGVASAGGALPMRRGPFLATVVALAALLAVPAIAADSQDKKKKDGPILRWAKTYETSFPFVLDPENQLGGTFGVDQSAPLNLVVDAKDMKVLFGTTGDKAAVIWPFIEENECDLPAGSAA